MQVTQPEPDEYAGQHIVVRFDAKKCIHSRHCVLDQPAVFRANVQGPWIAPDNASVAAVAEVAHACPSGAITYRRLDGGTQEQPPAVNTLRVRENGPLALRADIRLEGQPDAIRATLCRCGASQNKPYCDGGHTAAGFTASGEPATQPAEPLALRNGPLRVTPVKDGPLQVEGSLELCSGTGRTFNRIQKTWLCRCGGSQNKPYCDGSHKQIGFRAEGPG